jgi:hypothetical protein
MARHLHFRFGREPIGPVRDDRIEALARVSGRMAQSTLHRAEKRQKQDCCAALVVPSHTFSYQDLKDVHIFSVESRKRIDTSSILGV